MSLNWFRQWENISALAIAAIVLTLHLVIINQVESRILDEQHYIPEANAILEGEEIDNPEHPPLAKLILAGSIKVFGDNTVGWRITPILFGVAGIILFYLICQKLTSRRWIPVLATSLFAFENMTFVMSSVAMLDVFGFTFMLAGFLLYLHNKYIPSGITIALSALAKLSGAFAGGIILLHWLLVRRRPKSDGLKFFAAAPVAFLALMPLFDYLAMGELLYPWDRIDFMISTHSTLTFESIDHPALAYPWEWLFYPDPMWFWYHPTYQANVNWTLWALTIPLPAYAVYEAVKRLNSLCIFALSWMAGTWLIWIPIVLVTDRVMFKFYYYPSVGALYLILALGIHRLLTHTSRLDDSVLQWSVRAIIIALLLGHLAAFVIMSPYCHWPPASY